MAHRLRDQPLEERDGPGRVLRRQQDLALEQQRLRVLRLARQDRLRPFERPVRRAGREQHPAELDLRSGHLRVELDGFAEGLVGPAGVVVLLLDLPEQVVGLGVLRVDLDGVLHLDPRLHELALGEVVPGAVEELDLLLLRPAAGDQGQSDQRNHEQPQRCPSHSASFLVSLFVSRFLCRQYTVHPA